MYYSWLRPGGLLVITNVHKNNPNRHHMEHLLEWHLVYRNEKDMGNLVPSGVIHHIKTDETGMNLFLNIRKMD